MSSSLVIKRYTANGLVKAGRKQQLNSTLGAIHYTDDELAAATALLMLQEEYLLQGGSKKAGNNRQRAAIMPPQTRTKYHRNTKSNNSFKGITTAKSNNSAKSSSSVMSSAKSTISVKSHTSVRRHSAARQTNGDDKQQLAVVQKPAAQPHRKSSSLSLLHSCRLVLKEFINAQNNLHKFHQLPGSAQ